MRGRIGPPTICGLCSTKWMRSATTWSGATPRIVGENRRTGEWRGFGVLRVRLLLPPGARKPWARNPGESTIRSCSRGWAKPAQPVERSLENKGGHHLIDDSRALGTRGVLRDQRTSDGLGRKPFIPKDARARRKRPKFAREGASRLCAWTFR